MDDGVTASLGASTEATAAAYGLHDFGGPSGWPGRLWTRDLVRLPRGHNGTSALTLLQVRDVDDELVYELRAEADRSITFFSPSGGLAANAIEAPTGIELPQSGQARRIEVSALANDSVVVRIDGIDRTVVTDLSGASTGRPRYIRAGIVSYIGTVSPHSELVRHDGVGVSGVRWLGKRALLRPTFHHARRPKIRRHGRLSVRARTLPQSRVRFVVRGPGGRRLGAVREQANRQGWVTVRIGLRWKGQRVLRVRSTAHSTIYGDTQRQGWTRRIRLSRVEVRRLGR